MRFMRRIGSIFGALLLLGISFFCYPSDTVLIKNEYVNELAVYAMSYSSVALACGDKAGSDKLKSRLVKMLRLAEKKSSLTRDGRETLNDTDHIISMGAGVFKANPYISCAEGRRYKSQILERSDQLLRVN